LNTIAGRVIYQIFAKNYIVGSLTFHGGTNVIGYPWGSFNRSYNNASGKLTGHTAPDFNLFSRIGITMQEKAGPWIKFKDLAGYTINPYVVGDMTSTVYAVNGGLEDWAYAAGWDIRDGTGTMNKCTPKSYPIEMSIDLSYAA
jgi:hypothetical protein